VSTLFYGPAVSRDLSRDVDETRPGRLVVWLSGRLVGVGLSASPAQMTRRSRRSIPRRTASFQEAELLWEVQARELQHGRDAGELGGALVSHIRWS
jgi:hypothetical protein